MPGMGMCTGCNQLFSGDASFDMHRLGSYGEPIYRQSSTGKSEKVIGHTPSERRCLSVEEMLAKGMKQNDKGWWTTGEEMPTDRLKKLRANS